MLEFLLAVTAGILTFAAPCVLTVLPIIFAGSIGHRSRSRPFFIVLGFVSAFSAFTFLFGAFSQSLGLNSQTIRNFSIFLFFVFGLILLFPKLYERLTQPIQAWGSKLTNTASRQSGNFGALLLGGALGLVWAPCAGPTLGIILTLIFQQSDLVRAAILLTAYALGAGIPMLILAYGGQFLTTRVRSVARFSGILSRIFGLIVIAVSVAMFFGYDTVIQSKLLDLYGGQLAL